MRSALQMAVNRTVVGCLALLLLAQGCAGPSRGSRASLIGAGIATASLGLMLSSNLGGDDGGVPGVMIAGGLALTGYGFLAPSPQNEAAPPPAPLSAAQPTATQPVDAAQLPPLPRLAADPTTVRLAKQIRRLVFAGQCESAQTTASLIAQRSPDYYRALIASPAFGRCRLYGVPPGSHSWLSPQRRRALR